METIMKKLLCLIFLVFATVSFGAPSPFTPKDEQLINKKAMKLSEFSVVAGDENGRAKAYGVGAEGNQLLRLARAEYDVSSDGGTIGAHGLGVYLPAKALIIRSFFRIDTVFSDSGAGTVALSCEDADNLYAAADITGNSTGVLVTGVQDGFDDLSTVGSGIAARCEITATVATADQDAGKLTKYILYMIHE